MANSINKPRLTNFGFWDVDLQKLDFDKYAKFVIIRVMERGTTEDMRELVEYYGQDLVIKTITAAPSLMQTAIAAAKYYFKLKDEDFKCFTKTRPTGNLSMY